MKTKLERIIERLTDLRDRSHDDELTDEIDNALIHLDVALDRMVQLDEDNKDDELCNN